MPSTFALQFKDMPPLEKSLVIKRSAVRASHETWQRVWGKRKDVVDAANELQLDLEESAAPHRKITLLFRAYNDGAAFRYVLPEQAAFSDSRLAGEKSEFAFSGIPRVWAADYGGFVSHQESEFKETAINDLSPDKPYGVPMLVNSDADFWAAEHHLTVDFHGAYKPTGLSRTYPNLLTREGVMGNEYNKWSARITPDHCLTIPFTRMLAGGLDFTPGGFRQKTKDTFRAVGADAPGPFVMGTRSFQLAMLVVYESALQVLCDSPYGYHSSPAGVDFLKAVPTTWDDTRVVAGEVGDFIAIARRSGDAWFVGAMTDWQPRTLDIPLDFLGEGRWQAEIWRDADEADDYPDRLMKETKAVSAKEKLPAAMASGGGWVAVIRPEGK